MYFANGGSGIGVLTSDSPVGPWKDETGELLIKGGTPAETLQEKAECSEGLSPQSDQMDYRILQKRRYPLCGCGRHPKYPERKRYGTQDKPEISQPAV